MYNKEAVKRKIAKEGLIPTISLLTSDTLPPYIKEELTKNHVLDSDGIKVNTKITKKGKIKITNLDNFLLYRIVKVFYFI